MPKLPELPKIAEIERQKSFRRRLRSAAEPQPKETSTTEARRHGEERRIARIAKIAKDRRD
jgi:hypothetical protein